MLPDRSPPRFSLAVACVSLAPWTLLCLCAPAATFAQSPEQILAQRGLTKVGAGALWIGKCEARLQDELAWLKQGKENVQRLEHTVEQRIVRNENDWKLLGQVQKQQKETKDNAQKRSLGLRIDALRKNCRKPEALITLPDVQSLLMEFAAERDKLQLSVLEARRNLDAMPKEYERLQADKQVQTALDDLRQQTRLGPARSYAAEAQLLDEAEKLVATDWSPLFQQSGVWRLSGIVNERAAAPFTWETGGGRVILSGGVLELAGLSPNNGAAVKLNVGNRSFLARRVRLPELRFGACVLRSVNAFVLPPEAEDLGSRIGPKVFGHREVTLDAENLQLKFGPPR